MKLTTSDFADEALRFLGYPSVLYRGREMGCDEKGFDCSGFVCFLLKRLQVTFDHNLRHCNEFFDRFGVFIHRRAAQRGDLVFFSWNGEVPRHIGVVISPTNYIHAPGRDGGVVQITELRHTAIARCNPHQIYFENPIGFKRLAVPCGRYQWILR